MKNDMLRELRRIVQRLRRLGHSHADAEDIAQEALLRVHKYGLANKVANENALLHRTAHNLSINTWRRQKMTSSIIEVTDASQLQSGAASPATDPDRLWMAREQLERIERHLRAAGELTYEVFIASREGHTHREIAARFRITKRAVQTEIATALALLALLEMGDSE